jgi:hypothetical protein
VHGSERFVHCHCAVCWLQRRFFVEGFANNRGDLSMTHAWYDTELQRSAIAGNYYNQFLTRHVGANTSSYGFYGYEMAMPVDFFNIMAGH